VTTWREHLDGPTALDVAHLDAALGRQLASQELVLALLDPRGHLFQRLEYVGDALLDVAVLRALVLAEPWDEPSLSFVSDEQQALVSDHALGRVAARRGLPDVRTFEASRHRLADRIEAAIGAAWADAGVDAAEQVADRLVVAPGLPHLPRAGAVPDSAPDVRYEDAARLCGHDVRAPGWFGAAAAGGPRRRRLAVVGDAVLEAACSTSQYVDDPLATEAQMSEERRGAMSNAAIAGRAHELGLVPRKEDADDCRSVADEVQALVGEATFDGGFAAGLGVSAAVLGCTYAPGPVDVLA